MFDLIIKNGTVYDGTGQEKTVRIADVGVCCGKITDIGNLDSAETDEIIDATGKIVTPGFIDPHGHSDVALLANPNAESLVRQGITTQVSGQCGDSPAPISEQHAKDRGRDLQEMGISLTWTSFKGYREALSKSKIAINAGTLVGHGTVRSCACGYDAVAPTSDQMKEMVSLVERAMDEGAMGLSSGFEYAPGKYADENEVIPLAAAAARYGGTYTSHIRNEGQFLLESIEEAINVARKTGIPLQIAHLKSSGKNNWGKIEQALAQIEEAEREGVNLAFDRYPYLAGSTGMTIYFQSWITDGGREKMLERFKDPTLLARIKEEMEASVSVGVGWNGILINDLGTKDKGDVLGKSVQQIADERGKSPVDTAIDLIIQGKGYTGICTFSMNQEDTDKVLTHRLCAICTDASTRAPYGPLSESRPHPRCYGTFPRFLSEYVRDRKLVPLHEAVRRMCSHPAQRYSKIKGRGLLQSGYWADVVVFDLAQLEDRAKYGDSHHYPLGVDTVIVNGQTVIRNGEHTGRLPGTVL